jgi:xylulokinase
VPLVLGVGSGATSTTVEVRDADDGRLVASARASHPGAVAVGTQHPEVWWDGMADAIGAAGVRDVDAFSVAAQRQALVLVDGSGAPLCPASLRGDDRAGDVAAGLVRRLGAERLARATGHVPGPDTPLPRLAFLLDDEARVPERLHAVLGAHDHLTYRLTGRRVTDRSGASATGWWGPVDERWRFDLLDRAIRRVPEHGWEAVLPEVLDPGAAADWMSATVHELLRLRRRPLVAAGLTDVAARALAAGTPAGAAVALLGDDDAVTVARTEAPAADPTGVVQGFADATGQHLPTVALPSIGPVLDAMARMLSIDGEALALLAWRAPAPGDGPVLVPFTPPGAGGRPPGRRGALVGLDRGLEPFHVAAAALQGAGVVVADAVDAVAQGAPVILVGADAMRPGVAGTIADLVGAPVRVATTQTSAATGAAVQAAAALHGSTPDEVVAAWGLGATEELVPPGRFDGVAVRAAIAALTRRRPPSSGSPDPR